MHKAKSVGTAAAVGLLAFGAVAVWAQQASVRDGKDGGVSFRLATDRPQRGFEAMTIGRDERIYVANDSVFSGADIASAESREAGDSANVKLTLSGDALSNLRTQVRTSSAEKVAVFASGKVIAAGSLKLDGDRVSIDGLTTTQATRLTRVLNREGTVTPGAVVSMVPSAASVAPGGSVNVDVFVDRVSDLRSYQMMLAISGGTNGGITVSDLQIDNARREYVFGTQQKFDAVDLQGGRLGGVLMSGGVAVTSPAYLGSFTLTASPDASGTFSANVDQAGQNSLLWSSQNTAIAFNAPTLSVNVGSKPGSVRTGRE
jgi:hypothetical protein